MHLADLGTVLPRKRKEYVAEKFFGDADAVVLYREYQTYPAAVARGQLFCANFDAAVGGSVFNGVGHYVEKGLSDPSNIADEIVVFYIVAVKADVQGFFQNARLYDNGDVGHKRTDLKRFFM